MPAEAAKPLLDALIATLKAKGELSDPRLEAAFQTIERQHFLPDLPLEQVYADEALPVKRGPDGSVISSSSQPTMMAMMLRQLQVQPGQNILEIGAGTGYNAALLQYLVGAEGTVTTVELDKDLVQRAERHLQTSGMNRVRVVHTDGAGGYAPRAAYDRIIATVGVWDVPRNWVDQLKAKGVLVVPIWIDALQVSTSFTRAADGTLYSRENMPCGFVRLRGANAGPLLAQRIGTTSLILHSNKVPALDSAALHALLSDGVEHNLLNVRLSSSEYSYGFLPYFVLNLPEDFIFGSYSMSTNQQAYGLSGHGFALLRAGSACFVPFHAHGETRCFGGVDAFMAIQAALADWIAAGRPTATDLRLRLIPKEHGPTPIVVGQLYTRKDHYLHAWLETHD